VAHGLEHRRYRVVRLEPVLDGQLGEPVRRVADQLVGFRVGTPPVIGRTDADQDAA
jgi:hypothetical protein